MGKRAKTPVAEEQNATNSLSIHKHMRVADILTLLPHAEPVVAQYGLHCFNCSANAYETLDEGCKTHGFTDQDIDDLVNDLNELFKDQSVRPKQLTLTKEGAMALRGILEGENKLDCGLLVGVDEGGGFCMEVRENPSINDTTFANSEVPEVRIFASAITLNAIGGATIDFRDGRFKLDVPPLASSCGCGSGKECACKNGGECGCESGGACGCD